ncbi:MAG TPA: hypothetical protein VLF89_09720 [Candidatus Saccharimonadales bacterium]|nr:hypothetical protein [Candidatus Saccharimonadales bacterium]
MTIKRAREILGKRAENLTDDQILKLVSMLEFMCGMIIDQVIAAKKISSRNL